jgi:hypothetical protein
LPSVGEFQDHGLQLTCRHPQPGPGCPRKTSTRLGLVFWVVFSISRFCLQEQRNEEKLAAEEKIGDDDEPAVAFAPTGTSLNRSRSINRQRLVAHSTAMESIQAESEPIDEEDDVP